MYMYAQHQRTRHMILILLVAVIATGIQSVRLITQNGGHNV
ncbi:hypothetical protein SEA_TILLUMS_6 [Arthrobacter phage Tillums]|nr:hypothetical protein SEA_TILLUMS_6 [Arthrobacter phage Tillums]